MLSFEIHQSPSGVRLGRPCIIPIEEAWRRLDLLLNAEVREKIAQYHRDFRGDCAQNCIVHTEIQLLALYMSKPRLERTFNYLGCSKYACLPCDTMVRSSSLGLSMRGTHGKCYPEWGVPSADVTQSRGMLQGLVQNLVRRIQRSLEYEGIFQPPRASG